MSEVEAVTRRVSKVLEGYREFWGEWFGYHSGREVLEAVPTKGGWSRVWLSDPGLFLEHVALCEERGWPCYMSVNTYSARGRLEHLDRLFWDFDSKEDPPDLDTAWRDARALHDALDQLHHVRSLIVASGMKGYHVHAFLSTPITVDPGNERIAKAAAHILQTCFLQGLKLPTLDTGVLGDVARLARVPYTMHEPKALRDGSALPGGLCQPLTPERFPLRLDASDLSAFRDQGVPIKVAGDAIRSAWMGEEIRRLRREAGGPPVQPRKRSVRPCLEELLRHGSIPHKGRQAIVVEYRHRAGLGEDELVDLFRGQEDFDEDRTRYQVQHILKRGYKPWWCSSIRRAGFCLGDGCPLHRRRREVGPVAKVDDGRHLGEDEEANEE
jgi:hypothetical protein